MLGLAFQRARAAFLAMSERRFALRLAALALPPFDPPSRPSATAAGFFSPLAVIFWIRLKAATFGSLLGRLGISLVSHSMTVVKWVIRAVAVTVAGLLVAFLGIIVLAIFFGAGLGDPCPPYC